MLRYLSIVRRFYRDHVGPTGYGADVPVSGLDVVDAPLYEGRSAGADWIGGGTFGPEGSVITTGVLLVATVWLWRSERLRPGLAATEAGSLMTKNEQTNAEQNQNT